jgi:large subunit ribosomal protein L18
MKKIIKKQDQRERRRQRVRSRIFGSKVCPRLNVFRSLKGIYAQLIDDQKGVTLLAVGGKDSKASKSEKYSGKAAVAYAVGKELGKQAVEKGIKTAVFDRAGYRYHGRVQALAEGAREGGLKF